MLRLVLSITFIAFTQGFVQAAEPDVSVPMHSRGAATYYVGAQFDGAPPAEFMVDTGSEYVVVDGQTIEFLKQAGQAAYSRSVAGIMANGAREVVPIYKVRLLRIGCCCIVRDVEAAVLSRSGRTIMGLSALRKLAPIAISLEPPRLSLSGCEAEPFPTVAER
ncbi:MAG: aspartyl protease family protein [Gammaproteobacteria bacterium]|nr:aspartyl protease family protein [Gammaproteobacteria bacterium]